MPVCLAVFGKPHCRPAFRRVYRMRSALPRRRSFRNVATTAAVLLALSVAGCTAPPEPPDQQSPTTQPTDTTGQLTPSEPATAAGDIRIGAVGDMNKVLSVRPQPRLAARPQRGPRRHHERANAQDPGRRQRSTSSAGSSETGSRIQGSHPFQPSQSTASCTMGGGTVWGPWNSR